MTEKEIKKLVREYERELWKNPWKTDEYYHFCPKHLEEFLLKKYLTSKN